MTLPVRMDYQRARRRAGARTRREYLGWKSWLTLEAPVAAGGGAPVLSDGAFPQRVAAGRAILKAD